MSGVLWAAMSGVGFGIFQFINARAIRGLAQIYVATFVQLLVATVVFGVILAGRAEPRAVTDVPPASLAFFAVSGVLHFLLGWTTLNQSQMRIGAARTSPLLATSPVFGLLLALPVHGSIPGPVALLGILVTMVGAYIVTDPGPSRRASLKQSGFGLATSLTWALSAVFTVAGLRGFDDPLLGVTVGMASASAAYGLVLLSIPTLRGTGIGRRAFTLKLLGGVVVALATWWRWLALADAPIGVVLALQLLTVPTVLLIITLSPGGEMVTSRVWGGAALVLLGVGLLIATP